MLAAFLPVIQPAHGALGAPISTGEFRVSDHGYRLGAPQDQVDIGGNFMVWRDDRGDSDEVSTLPFGRLWSKNLSTRDEALVKAPLATDDPNPRISGPWVVWTDRATFSTLHDDIFARQLPGGAVIRLTNRTANQMQPVIDGVTVVFEDYINGNVDLYRKAVTGGGVQPVVVAPGNQTSPSISGPTVAWRDSRDGPTEADVYVDVDIFNATPPVKIADALGTSTSLSPFQVAVAGSRVIWNELDPACNPGITGDCDAPKIVKTCVLGGGVCGPTTEVDTTAGAPFGSITDLDLDPFGTRGVWTKGESGPYFNAHTFTYDFGTAGPLILLDDAGTTGRTYGPRVDANRFAWVQQPGDVPDSSTDIFWRTLTMQPLRANSISLGGFGAHGSPTADGDLVVYRRAPMEIGGTNQIDLATGGVWATDLSSPRRYFAVSTILGTDISRPAIVGDRVVFSQCSGGGFNDCGPVFQGDIANPGGSPTDLSKLGPPDADGALTGWRCGPVELCVHDGTTHQTFDISSFLLDSDPNTDAFSEVGLITRISAEGDGKVVWYEFYFDPSGLNPDDPADARLHVFDVGTEGDDVIGDGIDVVGDFPDFDVSGTNVIWSNSVGLRRCDLTAVGSCPQNFRSRNGHELHSPSIDGERVAWLDCTTNGCGNQDVYTKTISEADFHLVTNESQAWVESPHVDGDTIYWTDHRNGGMDIYMEGAVAPASPGVETTIPLDPTNFSARRFGNAIELTWNFLQNEEDGTFRVRILRKSGNTAPSGIDDITASVIYEGSGTSFTDTDNAFGVDYAYRIFAFDYEPNFSTPGAPANT